MRIQYMSDLHLDVSGQCRLLSESGEEDRGYTFWDEHLYNGFDPGKYLEI